MIEALTFALTVKGLVWLLLTLACYWVSLRIHALCKKHPLTHPLIMTALLVSVLLTVSNTTVSHYQQSVSLLHWALGPVTVALALPIFRQWQKLKHYGWPLVISIVFGGIIAPLLAWLALYALNAPLSLQLTMLVKSITTPLAMETASYVGGVPALAAVFVIVTGIVGAMTASFIFSLFGIRNRHAQGVALGTVAHAVGTAKAIHMGDDIAAMATLGLCVNGILTAIVLPTLFTLFV